MKSIVYFSKRFFPRVSKPGKIDPKAQAFQQERMMNEFKEEAINSEVPTLSRKEFDALVSSQNKIIYNKSKKDFPLLFSSGEEEDDFEASQESTPAENEALNEIKDRIKFTNCSRIEKIPNHIQYAALKIFAKYKPSDVREWTKKYLLHYSQNHAVEPPLDLTKLKNIPFGNSDELDIKTKIFKQAETGKDANEKKKESELNSQKEIADEYDPLIKNYFKKKSNEVNPMLRINYTPPYAIAYLYSRMPYTYSVLFKIMDELKRRNPKFHPTSILDYGAGLGSGLLAALDIFGLEQFNKIAAVEPNKYMRKLGKFVIDKALGQKYKDHNKEIIWVDALSMLPGTGGMERGKFDIIVLSHVLQEVTTSKSRELIVETLFNRLTPNGVMIVVEPGSPKGFRFVHDFREWVRGKIELSKKQDKSIDQSDIINILAPCPHALKCPLASLTNDWCHFSQFNYKYSKTVFPRESKARDQLNEKYSYLVIKKGKHIIEDIHTTLDESKLSLPEMSFKWHRLVRPTIQKNKHVIMDLCTTGGKLERRIISSSHGLEGGYKAAKRAKWGTLWPFKDRLPNKFRKDGNSGKRLW